MEFSIAMLSYNKTFRYPVVQGVIIYPPIKYAQIVYKDQTFKIND